MAEKKIAAPIDRPLSRAYLREFTGWSTAYPPGLSDPTSLQVMENVQINRDGSARVRPGLRYLSFSTPPDASSEAPGVSIEHAPVGSHEVFFLNNGSKAYLFAVREDDDTVGFRVLRQDGDGPTVQHLDDPGIDFAIPADGSLNFSAETTYVKYLQIDNKIFALSNAGENMRRFTVGEIKTAKALASIERPDWSVADKLTVVHPDAQWLNLGSPIATRLNLYTNPSFESATTSGMRLNADTDVEFSTAQKRSGTKSLALRSLPQRTNLHSSPGRNNHFEHWSASNNTDEYPLSDGYFMCRSKTGLAPKTYAYIRGPYFNVKAGMKIRIALDGRLITNTGTHRYGFTIRYFASNGNQIGGEHRTFAPTQWEWEGRLTSSVQTVPSGAVRARVHPFVYSGTSNLTGFARLGVKNVVVVENGEPTSIFDGASGANYFWTGAPYNSASVYHPPATATVDLPPMTVEDGAEYWAATYVRGTAPRGVSQTLLWLQPTSESAVLSTGVTATDAASWATRLSEKAVAPVGRTRVRIRVSVPDLPFGETHYIDDILLEKSSDATVPEFFYGGTTNTSTKIYTFEGGANNSVSVETEYDAGADVPDPETPTANTLISSEATDNVYNFGFFYTFSNEIGESAASQATVVRTQRSWSSWRWETANAAGEPSGTASTDPTKTADQLVAYMPQEVYDQALAQGAIAWNLYMFTWSDQAAVPSTAVRVGTKQIKPEDDYGSTAWQRATPVVLDTMNDFAVLPTSANRYNYSDPSRGGQGLVAGDRMIMVYDPTSQAVIRWSANQQGDYSNFTAAKGGGYKTLTSGNLYIPACVKLWQNPQSVDTITILCRGVDSLNTSYYMMPAEVSQQSESVQIMGFEETTATPGTTSPYGVETFNNALYHPLDDQLMKSTANNYNISHKTQTEAIRDQWEELNSKQDIISSQYDGRLYYIVNNPNGEPVQPGYMGNEIWVFDAMAENGHWSRWLIPATSLRKIEQRGRIFMSVVRPDGVFYLDPDYDLDDVTPGLGEEVATATIGWALETNTQGANRAHDAWAHLQQANLTVGNFTGTFRYGLRGWDQHGKPVEVSKVYRSPHGEEPILDRPFDHEDMLLIKRDLKEWFFFAQSEPDENEQPLRSYGQLNLVQYRYAPVSVNIGYELGTVESFEYGHAGAPAEERTTINGVPVPVLDARRP